MPRTKEAFQQIRDESKQHILDKAVEVFAAKGLANTKISDLAQAAGVSQGLLYRYFSDKDDVFIALLEQAIDGVNNHAQDAIKHAGTPLEKIHWLTEQILQSMQERIEVPAYFKLFSQSMALPGRAQETLMKFDTVSNILRELIIEGQKMGEVANRDPDKLLFIYFSCLYGLAAGKSFNNRWIDEHFPDSEAVLEFLKP